jgi:hypothetical protein
MSTALTGIPSSPVFHPATNSGLTLKQQLFIKHYLELSLNGGDKRSYGVEAAKLAGYSGSNGTLAAIASENLTKPNIRAEITRLFNPLASAEETLARLTKYSRSSIADVLDGSGSFDLDYAKANHADDLIKKLKIKRRIIPVKDGEPETEITHEIELYDAMQATETLAKHHGLLVDRSESIKINVDLKAEDLASILQGALSAGAIDVSGTVVMPKTSEID